MNPVAVITHLLAIGAGLWGGLWLMGEIAPTSPAPTSPPPSAPPRAPSR